jgi:hypothetical protein
MLENLGWKLIAGIHQKSQLANFFASMVIPSTLDSLWRRMCNQVMMVMIFLGISLRIKVGQM